MEDDLNSFSMILDSNPINNENNYEKINSRRLQTWVKNDTVNTCYQCLRSFSFFIRKHHCRLCGHIFCWNCSRFNMIIPDIIRTLPKYISNTDYIKSKTFKLIKNIQSQNIYNKTKLKERVCENCYIKLQQFEKIQVLINVFTHVENITIKDFHNIACVSHLWKQLGNFYLSHFREIQYYMSNYQYTSLDNSLLWNNRYYIISHNKYFIQLLISTIKSNDIQKLNSIKNLWENHRRNNTNKYCKQLMCSRICQSQLNAEDAIFILNEPELPNWVEIMALDIFDKVSILELDAYLPFLIVKLNIKSSKNIGDFLIYKCQNIVKNTKNDINIWNFLIKLYFLTSNSSNNLVEYYHNKLCFNILESNELLDSIIGLEKFGKVCKKVNAAKEILHKKILLKELLDLELEYRKIGIFNTYELLKSIDIDKIQICDSISSPIILPLELTNGEKKILYKGDDIRKDLIIMSLIHLINNILIKEENIDLNIQTYNILPFSNNGGIIELVENSDTLYKIREHKRFSLLNYIIEHNPNVDMETLRYRFMKSCAGYCVITYLLGIGDRHLDNIMMTNEGSLFHIDYNYILGYEPKPIIDGSYIRITEEMIDALGGENSKYYNEFLTISNRIYNCLRRHINLFMIYLSILPDMNPTINTGLIYPNRFDNDTIMQELLRRFIPGENYNQAEMHLYKCIESSSKTVGNNVIDFFHYHQQEGTINSLLNSTYVGTKNFLFELCDYFYKQNN